MMRYFLIMCFLCFCVKAEAGEIKIGNKAVFDVAIAKTTEELSQGLMYIKELPPDKGMLFDFREYPAKVSMWMKNTYIPLDMVFIDCQFKITDVYKNARPMSLEKISSDRSFCYVLEIGGGITDVWGITVGDNVEISFR